MEGTKMIYLYEVNDQLSVAWAKANVEAPNGQPVPLSAARKRYHNKA
jgi:hypothetical protein